MAGHVDDETQDVSNGNERTTDDESKGDGPASDTEIAAAFYFLTQRPKTLPANSSYSTIPEERTFTLFPELPIELRLNIWKHMLPGSRLIPFYTGGSEMEWKVIEYCAAANSVFAFALTCKESLHYFQSSYQKLPLMPHQSGRYEKAPFFFVDFSVDIVTLNSNLGDEKAAVVFRCLEKVRHLAITAFDFSDLFRVPEKFWRDIRSSCPVMAKLSFVHSWFVGLQGSKDKRLDEWRLINLPSDYGDTLNLPSVEDNEVLERRLLAADMGSLKFLYAEGQEWMAENFCAMEEHKNWSDISVGFCVRARRGKSAVHWELEYFLVEPRATDESTVQDDEYQTHSEYSEDGEYEIEEDEDDDDDGYHWHRESVVVTGDMITSCQTSLFGSPCNECGEKR